MGCGNSKLEHVEDSIHVILSSEKKKRQQAQAQQDTKHYVPRKEHPKVAQTTITEPDKDEEKLENLMYHAAHHNDSVDPRDLDEYGGAQEGKEEEEEEEEDPETKDE